VLDIEGKKEAYEKSAERLKSARIAILAEPGREKSDETRALEEEVESSRVAWENAKEVVPGSGVRVVTADNAEPQRSRDEIASGDGKVTSPVGIVVLR